MRKPFHPAIDLILLFAICFTSGIILTLISVFAAMPVFNLNFGEAINLLTNLGVHTQAGFLKWLQIFQSIGLFIVPAFIFNSIWKKQNDACFTVNKKTGLNFIFLFVATIIAILPIINITTYLNENINFPSALHGIENWMRNMENNAAALTEILLSGNNISAYLINIFMIAIIPAIGEELIFRGIVQNRLLKISNNIHAAIIITSILFSVMHMQFFGFLPRFLLGVLFGYIYYWSGNIWYPIIMHFTNNALAVTVYYFYNGKEIYENMEKVGATKETIIYLMSSIVISYFLITYIHKQFKPTRTN